MTLTSEQVLRSQDFEDAQEAWELYKQAMAARPRRQLRKRDLISGFIGGVAHERTRQMLFVHPNLLRAQFLIDLADLRPDEFETMKAENPELVARLRRHLEGS